MKTPVKLTKEQEKKAVEYHKRYWQLIVSTKQTDRKRAEKAARRLAEFDGVKAKQIIWVMSPEAGKVVYDTVQKPPPDASHNSPWDLLEDLFWDLLGGCFKKSLYNGWPEDSLETSFADSLWDSLLDSQWNVFWDLGRLIYFSYAVNTIGVKVNSNIQKMLYLYNEIAESCFALWIVADQIILCERPKTVKTKDGQLKEITWRNDSE